jgi:SMC interacting uncharacterized protein involved in chromosome segregation
VFAALPCFCRNGASPIKTQGELQRELDEKLRRIHDLKRRKPRKHCGHKEYSSPEDVAAALEIETLEAEVSKLRTQIAQGATG